MTTFSKAKRPEEKKVPQRIVSGGKCGVFERVIARSRGAVPSEPPSGGDDGSLGELGGGLGELGGAGRDLTIPARELKSVCARFTEQLTRQMMLREFDQAWNTAEQAEGFLVNYISGASRD